MSFYGNTYYLATQSFAKFVLNNLGVDSCDFPRIADIFSSEVVLDAEQRLDGLRFNTGNHWITMTQAEDPPGYKTNGFILWHNEPSTTDLTTIQCVGQELEILPPYVQATDKINLDFEDTLKVPLINYDKAGHISKVSGAKYFTLPKDPTKDLLSRMNEIDGKDNNPDTSSLKYQLNTKMDNLEEDLEERMDLIDGPGDSLKSQLEKAVADFSDALEDVKDLKGYVSDDWFDPTNGNIQSLLKRMTAVENDIRDLKSRI